MKKLLIVAVPMLVVATLLGGTMTEPARGQVQKGKTRPLRTKTLMGGLVGPNCGALAKGLKGDKQDWEALRANAELLNEAGHVLMADGRCPDKTWADATKTLRECSGVVLEKIEAEDAAGAASAFQAMTKACAACHKAHKPKSK